jgi:hypothetical protein
MNNKQLALAILLAIASFSVAWTDEPAPVVSKATLPAPPTVDQARRQAEILNDTLCATLQIVHHRYYREDEGLRLPANLNRASSSAGWQSRAR